MVESLSLQAKETMVYSFLKPEGDFQVAANQMEGQSKNLLVICHLPIIQEISESLLGKSFDLGGVYFEAGSCYCLKKEEGIWKVKWLFHPSELVF